MKRFTLFISILLLSSLSFASAPNITIEEYIEQWKEVAIQQMNDHHIPASITLAQGILESGFGNSTLALKANNHFGIKCHSDWKGKTFKHDDDKKNECFRKYKNALQSYEDHSMFLVNGQRYAFLFDLDVTDYKGWAHGLKKAGYATLSTYPQKLINLIEKYELNQYDILGESEWMAQKTIKENKPVLTIKEGKEKSINHPVYVNDNKTKYILAGKHDTFYQISKEFGINLRLLRKWNDFPNNKDLLVEGEKVYIMRKRKTIPQHLTELDLRNRTDVWKIAQDYGVQLEVLKQKNKYLANQIALN